MVTLKDIAEKCGVSISAVSLAINKPHKISKPQKEKILHTAHEMGYFNKKHINVKQILLVFNNFHDTYFGEYYNSVIFGILDCLYTNKITVQILSDFNVEYTDIYENQGIIFIGKTPKDFISRAIAFRIPFVLCGHPESTEKHPFVRFDIARGLHELIDYVVSCGHKRTGLIIGESEKDDILQNTIINTYNNSLEKLGITDKNIAYCQYNNLHTVETALNKILSHKPTVIFCADDHFAYVAYQILKKWELKVPLDVSIVGFDGIPLPTYLETPTPILTTVQTTPIELGRASITLLKNIIENPYYKETKIILPVKLKIGDSVKRLK